MLPTKVVTPKTPKSRKRKLDSSEESENKRYKPPEVKLEILQLHANGRPVARLAEEFDVGVQTIRDWIKRKDKIERLVESNASNNNQKKTTRGSTFPETNAALSIWFYQQRYLGKPVSRQLLAEKAKQFKEHLDKDVKDKEFTASTGFVDNFCSRNGFRSIKPFGEKLTIGVLAVGPFIDELHQHVKDELLTMHQLFNMDECGFNWQAFPRKFIGTSQHPANTKGRITLGLCSNASGTLRLPLIVIDKTTKPSTRFGRNFNMNSLPVHYRQQLNAWMDDSIFEEWFHRKFVPAVEKHLEDLGLEKKAILLVDNCAAHPIELVSKSGLIKTTFFPTNTNSLLQPMNQAPMAELKKIYRTRLLREYLVIYSDLSYDEYLEKINMKWVIDTLTDVWNEIPSATFRNSWRKLRFNILNRNPTEEVDDQDEELDKLAKSLGFTKTDVTKWLECDRGDQGYGILDDNEIIAKVSNPVRNEEVDDNEDEIDETVNESSTSQVSDKNLLQGISWIQQWIDTSPEVDPKLCEAIGYIRSRVTKEICLKKLK